MFFPAPDAASLVGEFTIAVTAQLGDGAVAGHWKVDIYNRDTNSWDNKGDLAGGELIILFLVVFSCLGSNTCFSSTMLTVLNIEIMCGLGCDRWPRTQEGRLTLLAM